ncbi:tetratricopeptide repeat protein [Treponema primitia]|uniref:tetratricopeptide repeat protein n=1 Tax=Treponema primitia TaxID=88058 RepID=UPI003980D06F
MGIIVPKHACPPLIFFLVFSILSCSTPPHAPINVFNGQSSVSVIEQNAAEDAESGIPSIDNAIKQIAATIETRLSQDVRIAVVNVSSPSVVFSDYVIEELIMALMQNQKLRVVDRNAFNFAFVNTEINFQLSGAISDETQVSIGKMMGAQSIMTASLIDLGDAYRLRAAVLNVETMAREATASTDVQKDSRITFLLTTTELQTRKQIETPETAYDYRRRGNEYLHDRKEYDLAIADFTSAIRLNPLDADAYFFRALAYTRKDDFDKALSDYTETLRLNPKYGAVYASRGGVYAQKNDYRNALTDLSEAIKIDPNDAVAYNNRALTYIYTKDYTLALEDLNKSISLDPAKPIFFENRAYVYVHLKDKQKAVEDLEKAYVRDPGNEFIHNRLINLRDYGLWRE